MGIETPKTPPPPRTFPRAARAVAFLGVTLVVGSFLIPMRFWFGTIAVVVTELWAVMPLPVIFLGWAMLVVLAWLMVAIRQTVAEITKVSQFSPRGVAWRFVRILPAGLIPLAAVLSAKYVEVSVPWAHSHWAAGVLQNESTAPDWQAARVLLWIAPSLLPLVCLNAAYCFLWWSKNQERIALQHDQLGKLIQASPPFCAAVWGGGFVGWHMSKRMFSNSTGIRLFSPGKLSILVGMVLMWAFLRFDPFQIFHSANSDSHVTEAITVLIRTRGRQSVVDWLSALVDAPDENVRRRSQLGMMSLGDSTETAVYGLLREIGDAPPDRARRLLRQLDRADPHWPMDQSAELAVPGLCGILADLTWVDQVWPGGGRTSKAIPPLRKEITAKDIDAAERRGNQLLNELGGGQEVMRVIQVLNEIDPDWSSMKGSGEAIQSLRAVFWDRNHPKARSPGWRDAAAAILRQVDLEWRGRPREIRLPEDGPPRRRRSPGMIESIPVEKRP